MNKIKALIAAINGAQENHGAFAATYGVIKKFGDDRANLQVLSLGWYGMLAIFPVLLVVITVFGFVGAGSLGHSVLNTLSKFPVVGQDFKPGNSNIHGSVLALVIGLLGALYGAQGVTQTAQHALSQVWNIPDFQRPGFVPRLGRSLVGLTSIGLAFVVNAFLSGYAAGSGRQFLIRMLIILGILVVNVGFYFVSFRVLTPSVIGSRALLPGSAVGAAGFTLLITVGTGLLEHQLQGANNTYGTAGGVIGLVTFLLLLAKVSIYATELNVVLDRHLYPRSLPTCDPLPADDRVLADIAQGERRRKDEQVIVTFGQEASAGSAGEESSAESASEHGETATRSRSTAELPVAEPKPRELRRQETVELPTQEPAPEEFPAERPAAPRPAGVAGDGQLADAKAELSEAGSEFAKSFSHLGRAAVGLVRARRKQPEDSR